MRLKRGDGGGTSGGMEERIARLEAHVEHIGSDVRDLKPLTAQMATLTERVAHLPSKGFIVTASISTVTVVTGLFVLLQRLGILH